MAKSSMPTSCPVPWFSEAKKGSHPPERGETTIDIIICLVNVVHLKKVNPNKFFFLLVYVVCF